MENLEIPVAFRETKCYNVIKPKKTKKNKRCFTHETKNSTPPPNKLKFAERLTALAAAALLTFSLAVPAFAEESDQPQDTAQQVQTYEAEAPNEETELQDVTSTGLNLKVLPTEQTTYKAGEGTIVFTPAGDDGVATLALNNVTMTAESKKYDAITLAGSSSCKIVLNGTNTISGFGKVLTQADGTGSVSIKVTITGEGSLEIPGGEFFVNSGNTVIIDGAKIKSTTECASLAARNIYICNHAEVDLTTTYYGDATTDTILSNGGVIDISDSTVTLNSNAETGIYHSYETSGNGGIKIARSTVTITSREDGYAAIASNYAGNIEIKDTKLTVVKARMGLWANNNNIKISGSSEVEINSTDSGIRAAGSVTFADTSDTLIKTNGQGLVASAAPILQGTPSVEVIAAAKVGDSATAALNTADYTAPGCTVFVNADAAAQGSAFWDGTTALSQYKYLNVTPKIPVTGWTGDYDGQPHTVTVGAENVASLEYSTDGTNYTAENPAYTDAADQPRTVYVRATMQDGKVRYGSADIQINKLSLANAKISLGKALQANGTSQTQTIAEVKVGEVTVPAEAYTVTGAEQTDAGKYTLTITATADGNFKDSCSATYVILPEDVSAFGNIQVEVRTDGNVPAVTMQTSKAALLQMLVDSGSLSADTLAQIADGASMELVLAVKEIPDLTDQLKQQLSAAMPGYTAGAYLDITLTQYLTKDGATVETPLHETPQQVQLSVQVPEAMRKGVNGTRSYAITRAHNGSAQLLTGSYDAAGNYTFGTDRFSAYALGYKDTPAPTAAPASNDSENSGKTAAAAADQSVAKTAAPATAVPQTGDSTHPALWLALMLASAGAMALLYSVYRKNRS